MEATPLAEDGFLYLSDRLSNVYKIHVLSGDRGEILRKTDPGINGATILIPVNRGVALYGETVLELTADGRVVGMAKSNGKVLFDVSIRTNPSEAFSAAPLAVKNKLIIWASGGDFGLRGWLGAFDLDKYAMAWRWYTVPAAGEPGNETWKDGAESWKKGGGSIWATGAYDPGSNLLYWGTGNPNKANDPAGRKGDNLYTGSTVALDAGTGALAWYFQYTPNDPYDYDEVGSQSLIDVVRQGKPLKLLSHFGRNGFYYTLDARTGRFQGGTQFVRQLNWTTGLNPKTGKPLEYDQRRDLQHYAVEPERGKPPVHVCPEQRGGVNYWPPSYSPLSKLNYAGTWEGCHEISVNPDKFMGGAIRDSERVTGSLTAVEPSTVRLAGRRLSEYPNSSGVTSTGGQIVITAFNDGTIQVLDDHTLAPLFQYNVGTFIGAPPMVYAVGGKEYIALITGGGLSPSVIGPYSNKESFTIQSVPMLVVFSL